LEDIAARAEALGHHHLRQQRHFCLAKLAKMLGGVGQNDGKMMDELLIMWLK
jgi:hypothetical protein